jgi:glycine oxidase
MTEAVVIGGGVMGLAAARELRRRGRTVTLLERAQPGRAASWASAGIIGATLKTESESTHHVRRLSRELWPAFAEAVQAESGLDPEYRETGCIHLAGDDAEMSWLEQIAQHDSAAQLLDARALREVEPGLSPDLRGGLLVAGGNVEPRRLCRALETAARRAGVRIRSGVEVHAITTTGRRVMGVETNEGVLGAELVVLAAGAWSAGILNARPTPPVHPQKGQILAIDQASVGIRHVLLTAGDPYFVPRCDDRLVVGATREETGWDASLTVGGIAWLLQRAMEVVPALKQCPIAEVWTGFRPVSADGLPLIGPGALEGLYFLTGHGPSGIAPLPATIALLMALIAGEPPPLPAEAFDPLRFERSD